MENVKEYVRWIKENISNFPPKSASFEWPRISDDPRRLARLLRSRNIRARTLALRTLSSMEHLKDCQCIGIIQSCYDPWIMSSLALRGSHVPFYIRRMVPLEKEETQVSPEKELRILLQALHPFTRDTCVQMNTELALRDIVRPFATEHEEVLWNDADDDEEERPIGFGVSAKIRKLLLYMEALGLESTLQHQRERMIDPRTFYILYRLWETSERMAPSDYRIPTLILKVLSNMALSPTSAGHFLTTGWISTLAKCRRSNQIGLQLLSEKCLENIRSGSEMLATPHDRQVQYDDGVYVLHSPSDYQPMADIIFVHGLRGGVFYSWRQKDSARKVDTPQTLHRGDFDQWTTGKNPYTYCWPKDWLPDDLYPDQVRVLGLDYASFVTNWRLKCPEMHERNTIIARSKDVLEKLCKAGVGDRPIIWVCHSMGGLIVKELLTSIYLRTKSIDHSEGEQMRLLSAQYKLVQNTMGIVFYSTPHYGSPIATMSMARSYRYFLLPSVEISELCENSIYLQKLHESFVDLIDTHRIPLISFLETVPSKFPMRYSMLIVPRRNAHIGIGTHYHLNESHLNTCKPMDKDSVNYTILVDFLRKMVG